MRGGRPGVGWYGGAVVVVWWFWFWEGKSDGGWFWFVVDRVLTKGGLGLGIGSGWAWFVCGFILVWGLINKKGSVWFY